MSAIQDQVVLEAPGCRATVDLRHGGRLASLSVDGWELMVTEGRDIYHWGSFILAPWTGRVRRGRFTFGGRDYRMPLTDPPNALHGLVVDVPWQQLADGVFGVALPDPWPWPGRLIHSIRLDSDRLESRLELHAEAEMPASIGWHPWFPNFVKHGDGRLMGPVELDVDPGGMYDNDEDGLPTGEIVAPTSRPWDYCFVELARPPLVRWADSQGGGLELTVESDCPCWVLYDEEPQAICVEPWTDPPDSLNLHPVRLVTPAEPLVATMRWKWRIT